MDYDVYSEMVFEDEEAHEAFEKVMMSPDAGQRLMEDQVRFQAVEILEVLTIEASRIGGRGVVIFK